MRRLLTGFVVAATTALVPMLALAGNQEVAEQIAKGLRNSDRMCDYKIGIKYQEGTVWMSGHVTNSEQMNTAMKLVYQTPGVKRIVNQLTVASDEAAQPAEQPAPQSNANQNVLRDPDVAPSAYHPLPVEAVSDEEPVAEPEPVAPQPARPIAKTPRALQQVAMNQAATRGPVAPNGGPMPMYTAASAAGVAPARYDQPCLPNYAWPSYAAYPNYASLTYPKQYSPTAWPYIGPFYPYPQVPLGWRKVTLEWDDGWWFLDFKDQPASCWHR